MATQGSPAVARHRLRLALRKAREAKDLTQGEVAASLDWSLSKLQRIEGGENSISATDTRALLQILGVTDGPTVEALVNDARQARKRSTWDEPRFREFLTPAMKALVEFESHARVIRAFQTVLVPGPLQTPELARHVISSWSDELSEEERAVRLEFRLSRRQVLARPQPPAYLVALDQSVLYRDVGGPAVFASQLRQLLADLRGGRIELRIVPFRVPAIVALGLPFSVMSLDGDDDSVLYRESHLVDELVTTPEKVRRHLQLFDLLWQQSFSKEESERLLEERVARLLEAPDQAPTRST
ncbi:helix-turn-helix transcriptional regulator [Hamadaea sp. NPDC050747]|uniref:helix-turn-helix domain-containing protein n=1 Tax=Hamadaea sp. NPDC050747 TaxID=3155789 RepID=UPI0033C7854E